MDIVLTTTTGGCEPSTFANQQQQQTTTTTTGAASIEGENNCDTGGHTILSVVGSNSDGSQEETINIQLYDSTGTQNTFYHFFNIF